MDSSQKRTGRGAQSNLTGRFETETRHQDPLDPWLDDPKRLNRTTVSVDATRTIIARNTSPDLGFDRSINPYRGCEHGCIYCYARPTHAYLGLSPGLDFERKILVKPNAAGLLRQELSRPSYRPAPIALGTNTDPYQPLERTARITRSILEVLADCGHPVTITTKNAAVVRDLDILAPMARRDLVRVALSITTLDRALARRMEPRTSTPRRRLSAIRQLTAAGIPSTVMIAPVIPALTDHELESIVAAAAGAGATAAGFILLRLPGEVADLFQNWLNENVPDRAARVLRRLRAYRGGQLYDSAFGRRMSGTGTEAALLHQRFRKACEKHGLNTADRSLSVSSFEKPGAGAQLALL